MCRTPTNRFCGMVFWAVILIMSVTLSLGDEIPYLISYQGRLTDSTGDPVADGDYQIAFSLWRDSTSINPADRVWISSGRTVTVVDGLFSYQLGSTEALPPGIVSNDSALWLGIQVESDPEITPRTRLSSSPYAFKAWRAVTTANADSALYSDTADYARAGGDTGGWADDGWAVRLENIGDYVGIGTIVPQEKLDVEGSVRMTGFLMPMGHSDGYVLTSDENGEGTWQPAGAGDITGVNAGDGLTGGGTEGEVTLDVVFAGNGSASTVSRSDHNHDVAYVNEGQDNSITGDMILHHSVELIDIEQGPASDGQVMSWSTAYNSWFPASGSGWAISGNRISLKDENDSVGIGTSVPSRKLDVRGDTYVQGNITWSAKTSYISIPAAAFRPVMNTLDYSNIGFGVSITGSGGFTAPLSLPHGAVLSRMTFYWSDASGTENGYVQFYSSHFSGFGTQQALLMTSGSTGNADSSYTESISSISIDNNNYVYLLYFQAYTNVTLYGVKFAYTFTEAY